MILRADQPCAEIVLMQGEEIQYCMQADGFFLGAGPILKLIANLRALVAKITGGHLRAFLVVTDMRVLMIESRSHMCGCTRARAVHAVASNTIVEAGSGKTTQLCFVHSRVVHLETLSSRYTLVVKSLKDPDLQAFVTHVSQLIIANAQRD